MPLGFLQESDPPSRRDETAPTLSPTEQLQSASGDDARHAASAGLLRKHFAGPEITSAQNLDIALLTKGFHSEVHALPAHRLFRPWERRSSKLHLAHRTAHGRQDSPLPRASVRCRPPQQCQLRWHVRTPTHLACSDRPADYKEEYSAPSP